MTWVNPGRLYVAAQRKWGYLHQAFTLNIHFQTSLWALDFVCNHWTCYSTVTCDTHSKRPHLSVVKFLKNKVLGYSTTNSVPLFCYFRTFRFRVLFQKQSKRLCMSIFPLSNRIGEISVKTAYFLKIIWYLRQHYWDFSNSEYLWLFWRDLISN